MIDLKTYLEAEASLIQREKGGGWSISCGSCPESELIEGAVTWEDALELSKKAGWRPDHRDGAWTSICPSCFKHRKEKDLKNPQQTPK